MMSGMDDLIIRSANATDLEEVRNWMTHDSGMTASITDFDPNHDLIKLDNPEDCWVAELHGELVALASLDEDRMRQAHLGFVVKPSRRRQGIAKAFIPRLLEHQDIKRFGKIIGRPGLADTAAQKVLRHAGFHQAGYDENGLIVFERR